jgi:hypothetical protein
MLLHQAGHGFWIFPFWVLRASPWILHDSIISQACLT